MKISELKDGTGKVDIEAKVIEKEATREVNTKFGRSKVANAVIEDDSGTIALTLWGDDADKVKEGDSLKIENGFVKEWNGTLQLSVGKYGKMTVL
ncbi:MAG: nucleic acid binding OB-fold tRNA/helicase-type [archaeon GW2011_AR5]|nr:MAG: nucleic acid binding OB-fold tRNA/helicase-type [archaeon GW2011_AR5]